MSNINRCWAESGRMSIYRLEENANLSHQVLSNLIDHHILCGMRKLKENRLNYKDFHCERRQKTWFSEDDTRMLFSFYYTHLSRKERREHWPCQMIYCKMRHNGVFLPLFGCCEDSAGVIQINYRDLYCDTPKQAIVVLLTLSSEHWPRRNERLVSTFSCPLLNRTSSGLFLQRCNLNVNGRDSIETIMSGVNFAALGKNEIPMPQLFFLFQLTFGFTRSNEGRYCRRLRRQIDVPRWVRIVCHVALFFHESIRYLRVLRRSFLSFLFLSDILFARFPWPEGKLTFYLWKHEKCDAHTAVYIYI